MSELSPVAIQAAIPNSDQGMPVLFIGHGCPMNAIEDNEDSGFGLKLARNFPISGQYSAFSATGKPVTHR